MSFDRFVGIAFVDRGRDILAGCDCWGLVLLVYREFLGVDLPSYDQLSTGTDRAATARLIAGEVDKWDEVPATQERSLDVVLMREGKFVRHVGVVTSPGMLLHVQKGETSRIERYRFGVLANRVVGFYRHREHE